MSTVIVGILVFGALAAVVWSMVRARRRGGGGCSSCPSCSSCSACHRAPAKGRPAR